MIVLYLTSAIVLLCAVTIIVWLGCRRNVREANLLLASERQLAEQLRAEVAGKAVELARAEAEIARLREKSESDRRELEKLQESFRLEFRNLANDILEEKSRQFKETNKESLDILLKPFRDNLADFKKRVEDIYSEENRQHGSLKSELKNLLDLNRRITQETTNLTNALKGSSKAQGDWGEMILERMLESSNLQKGVHYFVQENFKDGDGNNLRPDVVLTLPEGKRIVIDSKVSLTAYVGYSCEEDDGQRENYLREHIGSVRRHVNELYERNYQSLVDSPDFVIMFVPNEPAFMSAMQKDNSLWAEAYNKKVIVSSPTNLFALLKIVDDLWKRDNQSKHALSIAEEGGRLYDKFVGFVASLEDVGRNIDRAQKSYDQAFNQLKGGRGSLVTRSEKLRELGVKASKKLSPQLTDAFDENDGNDEPDSE